MKRQANLPLSHSGLTTLNHYQHALSEQQHLSPVSVRNYLSDLRHFIVRYEQNNTSKNLAFTPQSLTASLLQEYRTYLQTIQQAASHSSNTRKHTLSE